MTFDRRHEHEPIRVDLHPAELEGAVLRLITADNPTTPTTTKDSTMSDSTYSGRNANPVYSGRPEPKPYEHIIYVQITAEATDPNDSSYRDWRRSNTMTAHVPLSDAEAIVKGWYELRRRNITVTVTN